MSRHRLVSRTPDMIGEFLAAAAYVRQSDIAQRLDLATLGTRWRLTIATHGGVSSAGWIDRPPTAEIEQGATRLRPLMLKQETVYAPKVLNKLGRRVNDPVWRNTDLKPVQDAWKNFDTTMYWSAAVSAVDNDEPAPMRSDRQIAKDYRYGHLLHRDPERRQRTALHNDATLLQATTLYVKDGILLAEATSRLIQDAITDGTL